MAKGTYNARKRKVKKSVAKGVVHIQSTFNNTVVTITDLEGNALEKIPKLMSLTSLNFLNLKSCELLELPSSISSLQNLISFCVRCLS